MGTKEKLTTESTKVKEPAPEPSPYAHMLRDPAFLDELGKIVEAIVTRYDSHSQATPNLLHRHLRKQGPYKETRRPPRE